MKKDGTGLALEVESIKGVNVKQTTLSSTPLFLPHCSPSPEGDAIS